MNKIKDKLQARAKFNKGKRVGYAEGDEVNRNDKNTRYEPRAKPRDFQFQVEEPVKPKLASEPTRRAASSPASTQPAPKAPPGYIQKVGGGFEKLIPNVNSGTSQTGIENKGVSAGKPISKAQEELNEMNIAQQKALELAQTGQQPAQQSARMEREAMNPATGKLYTPEEKKALDASIDQRDFKRSTQAQQTTSNRNLPTAEDFEEPANVHTEDKVQIIEMVSQ
jgi:hypothetical protein